VRPSRRIRGTSLTAVVALLTLCLPPAAFAPAVLAQDATESPFPTEGIDLEPEGTPTVFCSILTADEASSAIGVPLTVGSSSDTDCSWDSDFQTSDISLLGARDQGDLELDAKEVFPEGHALTVGGQDAWYSPDGLALFVDVGNGLMFSLELFGTPPDGLDLEKTLSDLATIALPRLATVPVPPEPTDEPQPSYLGDPVLQALIPQSVGDAPVVVDVYSGSDLVADTDPTDPDAQQNIKDLQDVLSAHGKTIDDVSFANGYFATESAYGELFAVRVAGADITTFEDELIALVLPMDDPQRQTGTVAGKQVTIITDGPLPTGSPDPSADPFDLPAPPSYVYPSGEVLWIVSADEPQLTQLFQLLP
jgi:hypothetical protein